MKHVKIDRFPGGKRFALTMSYDDGQIHDRRLVDIFNRYGIKGTFHLNSANMQGGGGGVFVSPDEVAELYRGHEVAGHTATHPLPDQLPREELLWELTADRRALEAWAGYPVRGLSYPCGISTDAMRRLMKATGYDYARTIASTGGFAVPEDFLLWHPTCHHNHDIFGLGKALTSDYALPSQRLMYVWGHSYEFEGDDNWDRIEEFCKQLGGRDDIWYATNIEVYDYTMAQRALQLTVERTAAYNPSAVDVWLTVDGQTVCVPSGQTVQL